MGEENPPTYIANVGTRHPENYLLVDRHTGDVWQMEEKDPPSEIMKLYGVRICTWTRFAGEVTVKDPDPNP